MWICDINNQLRGRRVCMLSRWLLLSVVFHCCSVIQCIQFFQTSWTAARHSSLSCTISQRLLKLMSIEPLMPSNHLILCHPLLLLPSIFPSIKDFSNESALHIRWPKYWSFSFSISPSNEYWGLISFRIDWFDLLAVQGTIKSSPAPLFKSINSSLLSLLYGLTSIHEYYGKNIASNIQNLLARWHLCFLICCIGWS